MRTSWLSRTPASWCPGSDTRKIALVPSTQAPAAGTTPGSPITRTWCLLGTSADNPWGSRVRTRRRSTTVPLTCAPVFLRAGADHQHRDVVHQVAPAEVVHRPAHRRHQLIGRQADQVGEL